MCCDHFGFGIISFNLAIPDPAVDDPIVPDLNCLELHSEYEFFGKGSWEDLDETNGDDYATHFVFYAIGEAILNGESGVSKLYLIYDPNLKSISGILSSRFQSSRLDHTFTVELSEGLEKEIPAQLITDPKFVSGTLRIKKEVFVINEKVSLEISSIPLEGEVTVKVIIDSVYCTQDI